jgi:hypothetical protein
VRTVAPMDVEAVGVREVFVVPVGRSVENQDDRFGRDALAEDLDVPYRIAALQGEGAS